MAPDFEYFVRGEQAGSGFGHTWLGVLAWGLPMTLLLAALYHGVVKWPLLVALPARATPLLARPWPVRGIAGGVSCTIAALAGNATHVVWDGATHAKGMIVRRVPSLTAIEDVPVLGTMTIHRILQHASTVVGLTAVVLVIAWQLWRTAPPAFDVPRARARWTFAACIAVGVTVLAGRVLVWGRAHDIGNVVVGAISGLLAGVVVGSLLVRRAGQWLATRESADPELES